MGKQVNMHKALAAGGIVIAGFATACMALGKAAVVRSDQLIAQMDKRQVMEAACKKGAEIYHAETPGIAEPEYIDYGTDPEQEYPWQLPYIAKVVGFETGWCCDRCKYYVASACCNRMVYWYGGDVIAMITDGNDEYYQMYPGYVDGDEFNGFNIWEHYDDCYSYALKAARNAADIYFWDCEDSQGGWAELVWHCEEDGMWFYR